MSLVSGPKLNYFLVHIPDLPNAQRTKHEREHIEHNGLLIQSGLIRLGGGLLPPETKATDADAHQKIVGSWIIVQADSIDAVSSVVKKDIYYTSGEVWDHEKIQITPVLMPFKEAKFD
ncbi:hypothetical protein C8Q77DRAFT_1162133 [Trametes polyzona]|nr:hypothetical protein C8Q77DRAFT_1162133 [Trametes polyzona]